MAALTSTVVFLLLILTIVYLVSLRRVKRDFFHLVIFSLGKVTLIMNTLASIAITFWITFGGEAFQCENGTENFLVNITNTVCYSVIFLHLVSKKFDRPLSKFCVRCVGFIFLVGVQTIVSALAHFVLPSDHRDESHIVNCSEERQKPLTVVSYCYSVVLLSVNAILYFFSRCSMEGHLAKSCVKMTITIFTASLYLVFVILFLLWDEDSDCVVQARLFIVISLYPSLICLSMVAIATVTLLYKMHRRKRDNVTLSIELKGNPNCMFPRS